MPIHIRGDALRGDMTTQTVVSGSVTLDQGTMHVEAELMTINWSEEEVQRITASGNPARFTRAVRAGKSAIDARAQNIIYERELNQIKLQGMALLTKEGNQFRGEIIIYDIAAGLVTADSASPGRVELIWRQRE